MRPLPRTPVRALSGLLALVLATAVAVLAAAPPAAAHGGLAMSTPKADATVDEPLTTVQLYFTEQVAGNAYFAVTAPGGARVDNGWTHGAAAPLDQPVREYFLVDGVFEPREYTTGFPAVVNLAHLPSAGQYTVSYLSVASDGEPVRGTMSFRYTGPVTPAPAGWNPPTDQPDPALLAAADQHGHDSGSSPAPPAPPGSPPAAAGPAPAADGGLGAGAWAAIVVAVVAALVGLLLWRRRPLAVARFFGRAPAPVARGRRTGPPARARKNAAARAGKATRTGGAAAPTGTAAGRGNATGTTAGRGNATGTTAGRGRGSGAGGTSGTGRRNVVPAARRGGAAVTASVVPATASAPPVSEVAAGQPTPAGGVVTADGPDPRPAEVTPASGLDGAEAAPGSGVGNARLALLVGGLVITLLAGFGLGRLGATEQQVTEGARPGGGLPVAGSAGDGHQHAPGTGAHSHAGDGTDQTQTTGAWVSAAGYTLQPVQRSQPPGTPVDYQFRIVDANRQAVTEFAVVHEKPLHLIVVGRDLSGYQHLHPTMTGEGLWSVPLDLPRAGDYRVYADFTVGAADGRQLPLVLGVDHQVPGVYTSAQLPPPRPEATTGPFTVSMEGTPTIGLSAPVVLRVADGSGPAALEPYLGAYGHLVVVREGDLGYVHVHPEPELVDGAVKFWLTVPSAGRYRAFFDFQVEGKVHTADYTIDLS
ncbi:copper resistance CopC family protein [Micromonospora radicis]|uniref:Copper resistance protein CopC n=1 Tax=Micromonospora radicis TaxID=1894971 RepID=A0A418N016_9ACTN|nr:copper resistance protein CopC [Micromonospora radicis]RIV41172.1 copper resistance protein CopC [Micromonospora radicis]